jgi:lipoprotein-anchoring transpeptidase ErfK/SrfK
MKTLKVLLLAAATLFAITQAKADVQAKDLADLMSPDDIASEFDFGQADYSDMLLKTSAELPRLQIVVNKAEKGTAANAQTLEAFLDGELLYRTVVSTGKEKQVQTPASKNFPNGKKYWAITPAGSYKIYKRDINHVSGTWPGASMPFAQFFRGGVAIHATTPNHFAMLGQRDSGGCVRLHPVDAKLMWELVTKIGVSETQITVYDGSKSAHPLGLPNETPRYENPKRSGSNNGDQSAK